MKKTSTLITKVMFILLLLSGCSGGSGGGSGSSTGTTTTTTASGPTTTTTTLATSSALDTEVRGLLTANSVEPLEEPVTDPDMVALGQVLFFDKELGGNRDISCATCHRPDAATGDAISLGIGTGGTGIHEFRVPLFSSSGRPILIGRNTQPLFFMGELDTLLWDGGIRRNSDGSITTAAGNKLLPEAANALAALSLFPAEDRMEMRGEVGENELAAFANRDFVPVWDALLARLLAIPEYVNLLAAAFPEVATQDLTFAHAANAMADYQIDHWSLTDSPIQRYLRGDNGALTDNQKNGAIVFYDKGNCASCHSGSSMTDQDFHNRVVPQIGPGKGDGDDDLHDFGRERVTDVLADRFKFRTPPLHSVTDTGPYMHDGAFTSLEGAVRHCMDPAASALAYDPLQLALMLQDRHRASHTAEILALADPSEIAPVVLTDDEFNQLMDFLAALSSDSIPNLPALDIPDSVPSGLSVLD